MTLPVNTYNTTDQLLKYTVIQELRAQGIAFEQSGESRLLLKSVVNQTTVQTAPAGHQSIYIENAGDVTITVEYPDDTERNFEIEAGGNAKIVAESYNGLPEINVLPGDTEGEEVNSISLTLQKFV